MTDSLELYLARSGGLRVRVALTTQTAKEAAQRHGTTLDATRVLAEAITAVALLPIEHAKHDRVSVQWTGQGAIKTALAELRPTPAGATVRAYVDNPGALLADQSVGVVAPGRVVVMRQRPGGDYDLGQAALETGVIDRDLEAFMLASDQIPTKLCCRAQLSNHETFAAGGVLLQRMPDGPDLPEIDREALLNALGESSPAALAAAALPGLELNHLASIPLAFSCPCSLERVADGVRMLEVDELAEHAADGSLGVDCQFCATHYQLDREALQALIDEKQAAN